MSYITDVVAVVRDPHPKKIMEDVQKFAWESGHGGLIYRAIWGSSTRRSAAVPRCSPTRCGSGSFNYFPIADFLDHLEAIPWNPVSQSTVLLTTEGQYLRHLPTEPPAD